MSWSTLHPFAQHGSDAVSCDNCGWEGTAEQTVEINDPSERLDAGGTVPAGQCPEEDCGALAYLVTPKPPGNQGKAGVGEKVTSCARCGSKNVQVCLPAWFWVNDDMALADYDAEAQPLAGGEFFCADCEGTEHGGLTKPKLPHGMRY